MREMSMDDLKSKEEKLSINQGNEFSHANQAVTICFHSLYLKTIWRTEVLFVDMGKENVTIEKKTRVKQPVNLSPLETWTYVVIWVVSCFYAIYTVLVYSLGRCTIHY